MKRKSNRPSYRVLYYSHDTYGLGHLRRTMALVDGLRRYRPGVEQCVVTGSTVADEICARQALRVVNLPPVIKLGAGEYAPRESGTSIDAVIQRRSRAMLEAVQDFEPDVLVVDHAPVGLQGEALPSLEWLRDARPRCLRVLGLRDVIDTPKTVREQWRRRGIYRVLQDHYDRVLIYGDRSVYDTARAYALPGAIHRKLRFVGYLGRREPSKHVELVPREPGLRRIREVLVTTGGGGDGRPIFEAVIDALEGGLISPGTGFTLVLGPLMSEEDRAMLHRRASAHASLKLIDFEPAMQRLWSSVDAVVAMGGYNTMAEIVAHRLPAIIVPRTYPRREQMIRALAFQRRLGSHMRVIPPEALQPGRLVEALRRLPPRRGARLTMNFDGLRNFAAEIDMLQAMAAQAPAQHTHSWPLAPNPTPSLDQLGA